MSIARALYTLLGWLALPVVVVRLLFKRSKLAGYGRHVRERFGRYRIRPHRPVIWLHAVSVGETRAAEPIVRELKVRFPEYAIIMTHMTPTGRATSRDLFGESVRRAYLPYDLPLFVKRFLRHFQPRIGIILETELWPNLIAECSRRGIPVLLANARLSERSARRYAWVAPLTREMLRKLAATTAQSDADAQRLTARGARQVRVSGNVKFDVTPDPALVELGQRWREAIGLRPVWIAASTRDGEETLILDAMQRAPLPPDALLILVPRHPQRFEVVAGDLDMRRLRYVRRSTGAMPDASTQVWLGDSMGEMAAYFAASDCALMGGSLRDFGSQNLIEPCALGCPVVIGPSRYNFAEASMNAIDAGAAVSARNATDALALIGAWFADPEARHRAAQQAIAFTAANRGAVEVTLSEVTRLLKRHITVTATTTVTRPA